MSRRAALVALAVLTVGLGAILAGQDERMRDAGGHGILPFELAFGEERAEEIKSEWGDEGRDAARTSLLVDYAFLLAYGAFLTLAAMATRDVATSRGWGRMVRAASVAIPAGAVAAGCDALENAWLLLSLEGASGALAPLAGSIFACLKFAALSVAVAYLLAGLGMRLARQP